MTMSFMIFGAILTLALVLAFSLRDKTAAMVERRTMRSLKTCLERGERTPQRRLLALSRMM